MCFVFCVFLFVVHTPVFTNCICHQKKSLRYVCSLSTCCMGRTPVGANDSLNIRVKDVEKNENNDAEKAFQSLEDRKLFRGTLDFL